MPSSTSTESFSENDPNTKIIYHEQFAPPWRALLAIVFPIAPIFWNYTVNVTTETLTIGYSYCYSNIDRDDIVRATPIEHANGLTEWGGWGLRYNLLKWETGYIVKNGPAVRIEVRRKGSDDGGADHGASTNKKVYVFNTGRPQKVCDILNGS
uniref:Uncharacterized protein n=1 Tax=Minutocellus polymorphus TaxID=265543 RepID=A0A6U0JUZ2_9STRA|mmetsp:Transcript_1871/g.3120  ORF Transcript_1871/g.3120 Transcript_1871/m.3120 type:complete len:153 (+) Transcript_1871:139-597(+)